MHDSDILLLKLGIPDKNNLFVTLRSSKTKVLQINLCVDLKLNVFYCFNEYGKLKYIYDGNKP